MWTIREDDRPWVKGDLNVFAEGQSPLRKSATEVGVLLQEPSARGFGVLVWCTVKLDTDLGIVTQRRCPDAFTRIIHRAPRARSSESDWRGEHQWLAETPAVFCTAEDRGRPPAVTWGTA